MPRGEQIANPAEWDAHVAGFSFFSLRPFLSGPAEPAGLTGEGGGPHVPFGRGGSGIRNGRLCSESSDVCLLPQLFFCLSPAIIRGCFRSWHRGRGGWAGGEAGEREHEGGRGELDWAGDGGGTGPRVDCRGE